MMTPAARDNDAKPHIPRDVVFVIDTSGSMGGTSIVQAKSALTLALDRLTADDRFNVIQFNSVTEALFPDVQPWTGGHAAAGPRLRRRARRHRRHGDAAGAAAGAGRQRRRRDG